MLRRRTYILRNRNIYDERNELKCYLVIAGLCKYDRYLF